MQNLTSTTIRQAYTRLSKRIPELDQHVFGTDLRGLRLPAVRTGSLTPWPVFYRADQTIECAQSDFFGFYALRRLLSSTLRAVNFQIAGALVATQRLYAPAVGLFYTSAYHALHSYLALNGVVIYGSFHWPFPEESPQGSGRPLQVAARLTKDNRWIFEPRRPSHARRWLELRPILRRPAGDIPDYFHRLFDAWFPGLRRDGATITEVLKDPVGTKACLTDHLDLFLGRLAEARAEALYNAFGEDADVVDALANRDAFTTLGIERHSAELGLFSQELLQDVASTARLLLEKSQMSSEVRRMLIVSLIYPTHDPPRVDGWADNPVARDIQYIQDWLAEVESE